jgi:hypothetical protein
MRTKREKALPLFRREKEEGKKALIRSFIAPTKASTKEPPHRFSF